MGVAVYTAGIRLPGQCPPEIVLNLDSGLGCHIRRQKDGAIRLELESAAVPSSWPGSVEPLLPVDDEAHRVVAAVCFHYAAPFVAPMRETPKDPGLSGPWHYDLALVTLDSLWPAETAVLTDLLAGDDPRVHPLWQTLTSVGGLADPLARFVALWGLLDIGLEATRVREVDDYLVERFGVPCDQADQNGKPNCETKFGHLRHQISHPADRSIQNVAALSSTAGSLIDELTAYCQTAIREGFAVP